MSATTLYRAGMLERFLFDVDEQQRERDVEVRELQRGGQSVRSFRLADDPEVLRCASPAATPAERARDCRFDRADSALRRADERSTGARAAVGHVARHPPRVRRVRRRGCRGQVVRVRAARLLPPRGDRWRTYPPRRFAPSCTSSGTACDSVSSPRATDYVLGDLSIDTGLQSGEQANASASSCRALFPSSRFSVEARQSSMPNPDRRVASRCWPRSWRAAATRQSVRASRHSRRDRPARRGSSDCAGRATRDQLSPPTRLSSPARTQRRGGSSTATSVETTFPRPGVREPAGGDHRDRSPKLSCRSFGRRALAGRADPGTVRKSIAAATTRCA